MYCSAISCSPGPGVALVVERDVGIAGVLVDLENVIAVERDIGLAEGLAGLGGEAAR